jgi:surface antigen
MGDRPASNPPFAKAPIAAFRLNRRCITGCCASAHSLCTHIVYAWLIDGPDRQSYLTLYGGHFLVIQRTSVFLALAVVLYASSATAQFGSFPFPVPTSKSQADALTDPGCKVPKKKKGSAILGTIVGKAAGNQLSRTGMGRFVPVSEFTTTLTQGIACRLDPEEQKKASVATDSALRSNKVGSKSTWTSATRENVTGTSVVTAKADAPPGQAKARCMMVTDVVIVDGEEVRAEKKMCKGPGEPRYQIAQV